MRTVPKTKDDLFSPGQPPKRVLHLLDIENLVGTPRFSSMLVAQVHAAYKRVAPIGAVNQLVVASSHLAAVPTWFGLPADARRLVRSGPNGADLALLEVLEHESVAARFQHVVIGSGDGIFALPAAALQAAGCGVTVVTQRTALSRHLGLAVRDVRFIGPVAETPAIDLRLRAA